MQPEYTTAVSRYSANPRIWRWVIYKDSVEFRAGLSNAKKAAKSDANACLELLQKPAVELTKRAPAVVIGHWTPVTEKMPDDEITVLVWVESLDDATLAYHCSEVLEKRGDSGWILAGHARAERVLLGVTHWCQQINAPNTEEVQ
jgi:hypothetical protein